MTMHLFATDTPNQIGQHRAACGLLFRHIADVPGDTDRCSGCVAALDQEIAASDAAEARYQKFMADAAQERAATARNAAYHRKINALADLRDRSART